MASSPIKTVVALDQGVDTQAIEASFPLGTAVQIAGIVEGLDHGWRLLEETAADVLVVACASYSERALYLIEGSVKQHPERAVVVFYRGEPNGFMRRAFEAGADDLITLPRTPAEIEFALEKVIARRRSAGAAATLAPLICVLGPKGGSGKTLTSCNLSAALALAGRRVALVDLDLQFGDIGIALGLSPDRTIFDLVRAGGTVDADKVRSYLVEHPSGVSALLAPNRPDQASAITVEFLREVYAALRSRYDVVVVDTAPGFTPEVIASIDSASDLCVVGMLDALSLKDTKLGLETLSLMGYDGENIRLVLNRVDSGVGITEDDVATVLGRRPDIIVPTERAIPRSVTDGRPIVLSDERATSSRAFRSLAAMYLDTPEVPIDAAVSPNGHNKSLVARLLKRRRKES